MNEKDLHRLLHVRDKGAERRGWRCPDDTRLAAYVDHQVSPADQSRIESHLAKCDACLEQVVFLTRHVPAAETSVAPNLLARAKDLVGPNDRGWPALVLRWSTVTAAVACVVFVVALVMRQPGTPTVPGAPRVSTNSVTPGQPAAAPAATSAQPPAITSQPNPSPLATVRKSVPKPLGLQLRAPTENGTVSQREPTFRWQSVPGAVYYEIQIVTEEGNVVWQGKSESTNARLPGDHPLQSGTKYFVWVRAYLSGGGTVKSAAVSFHVGG